MATKKLSDYEMKKRNNTPLDLLVREYVADMRPLLARLLLNRFLVLK